MAYRRSREADMHALKKSLAFCRNLQVLVFFPNSDNAVNTLGAEIEKVVDYEHKHRLRSNVNPALKY